MVRSLRVCAAVVSVIHILQLLPTPIAGQEQSPYPICYACGCQTCEVGDYEGRIPIPEELRGQVGGFSELSCFQVSQAGLAGLIPPDICNLNKSRELHQACQCSPLPSSLAPTRGPTVTRTLHPTQSIVPSVVAFDAFPSIEPSKTKSPIVSPTQLPMPKQSIRPSLSTTQSPTTEQPTRLKTDAPQSIHSIEYPVGTSKPTASIGKSKTKTSEKYKEHTGEANDKSGKQRSKSSVLKKRKVPSSKESEAGMSGKGRAMSQAKGRRKRLPNTSSDEAKKESKLMKQRRPA